MECFLLKIFLDRIYTDRASKERYNLWSIPIPGFERDPYERPVWTNTPLELLEQYNRECPKDKGFETYEISMVRKTLKKLEDDWKIIKKNDNIEKVTKESKYYPVETTQAYISLLEHVQEEYVNGFYPNKKFGLNPIYSKYSEIVLNRQFILDCLRMRAKSVKMIYNDKLVDIPFLGRYRKNYELAPRIRDFLDVIDDVKEIIKDETETDYRTVRNYLLDVDEPLPESYDDMYYKITPEKRQSNLVLLNKLKAGLEIELGYLDKYSYSDKSNYVNFVKLFTDGTTDRYANHLKELSADHHWYFDASTEYYGFGWYRQESTWEEIELTEDERKRLRNIDEKFADEYQFWLDGRIVLPLLCLAQFSPTVLFTLALDKYGKQSSGYFTYSMENDHKFPYQTALMTEPKETIEFKTSMKSFNAFLGVLCKGALADYLSGRSLIRDVGAHDELAMTQIMTVGYSGVRFTEENERYSVPALFTFKVYKDWTVSIMFSECPVYNHMWDLMSPIADHPRPIVFDWSPAIAYTECHVSFPSSRLYEIVNFIISEVHMGDFCLSHLIDQAVLKGTI